MSHQKDRHYWTQLRSALTAGQWSAQHPAKAPHGIALSWTELFRKFNKHCRGFQDIIEIASQTHALALLLAANSTDEDQDDVSELGQLPLDLGAECMLPEERIEEASAGYEALKQLKSSFDTLNFALAYYAYALGSPSECLSHLRNVPDVLNLQNHIPAQSSVRSSNTSTLQVPTSISSTNGSFASLADSSATDIKDGRGWAMTETLRSICLQGMSHEKLLPSKPQNALDAYGAAIPLLTIAVSEIAPNSAPTTPGNNDFQSFTQYRELWRWAERLIWRAVVLAARTGDIHDDDTSEPKSLWTWLGHYTACSAYWPANFRTAHRSTVSVLYLRALILRYQDAPGTSSMATEGEKSPPWLHSARSVINDYRAILNVSTSFPRAGERNVKVEDFVDLCVGVWEASGAIGDHAGWVLDILWWATRLTFNSFRILRHMTRLLDASGDTSLAKRTLRLYVQVVGKAWQTNNEYPGDHTDDSRRWVETLVSGARMLCKSASLSPGLEGIEDVREAGILIEKARTRLEKGDEHLLASVDLAEGVWNSIMALKEQDPHTRPRRLADAHALLVRSVETSPTPSGHFHLALSFARPGPLQDLGQAIENAGLAVGGDASDIRYWHLLGLLLAVMERWKDAGEIFERGAELGEADAGPRGDDDVDSTHGHGSLEADAQTLRVPVPVLANGGEVRSKDFEGRQVNGNGNGSAHLTDAGLNATPEHEADHADSATSEPVTPLYILDIDAMQIPPAASLLKPIPDHLPPSKQDIFEHALQLRMSQVALIETVEGAESAELKWLAIFSWVAEKKGTTTNEPTPRPSIEGSRPSAARPPSIALSPSSEKPVQNIQAPSPTRPTINGSQSDLQPIPITISPATPNTETTPRRSSSEKKRHGGLRVKRSSSTERDTSKSKKVQQMLKNRVHKGQARITTISRKIGNGVVGNGSLGSLRRSNSTPDFHAVLRQTSYQASSIHSRRRLTSFIHPYDRTPNVSPSPPPPPPVPPIQQKWLNSRRARSDRIVADLWLMSAATFRRLGKIEQAKGAIQEAEVRDEGNSAVWVQLGLYYVALGHQQHAIDAFQKALFISPDDIAACVHLARLYLSLEGIGNPPIADEPCSDNISLAAGMLSHLTRGVGWDVPEAWYFLAKAYGMQGRRDHERECLGLALELSERRGIREIGAAVGWCM